MKNAVFWDVAPCTSCVNRCFGGTYRLHLQGIKSASEEPARAGGLQTAAETSNLTDKIIQNYWVLGLFPSSGILENTTFRKLNLFPSSGEG
jgi:hypothetical protein